MRNIICLIMALLPFGMWAGGCRKEIQSARMPGSQETARILRAPGSSIGDVPAISPAEIDPSVAGVHAAHSRVRAVADREAVISSRHDDVGLFVLPSLDGSIQGQGQQPVQPPARIWSRPVSDETPPELTPLQFHSAQFDAGLDHLMAMAPGKYPNLDPGLPHGDPTLIPGMYFGPDNVALGGTRREIKAGADEARPGQITSEPQPGVQPNVVEPENVHAAPIPLEDLRPHGGLNGSQPIRTHPAESEPANPARPALIKLKPITREENTDRKPPVPSVKATGERPVVDKMLEADLLELPNVPQSSPPPQPSVPAPGGASSSDPLALDLSAIMSSSAWEKENETALPPEPVADARIPASAAPAAPDPESATPATTDKSGVGADSPGTASMEMHFSEIAPPPLPETNDFLVAPAEKEAVETYDRLTSSSTSDAGPNTENASGKIDSSWLDDVGTAGDAEKPKAVIQPLLNIDFSMYDWEMKTVPQKPKPVPAVKDAEAGKKTGGDPSPSPDAPPIMADS